MATTHCVRCAKGYQGDYIETADTGDPNTELFTLFYRGLTSCDIPIINCEYFKNHYGFEYIPISRHRQYVNSK